MKPLDITGDKYGRLSPLKRVENDKYGKAMWLCACECGKEVVRNTAELRRGKVTSCGCARSKHGMSNHRFHKIWGMMKQRCDSPKTEFYYCYGGRGINYQESWSKFENFYDDMFHSYKDGLSLERVDVLKGYTKDNCTWIPLAMQARNTRARVSNKTGVCGLSLKCVKGVDYLKASMSIGGGKKIEKQMSLNKHEYEYALTTLKLWLDENRKLHNYGENHGK